MLGLFMFRRRYLIFSRSAGATTPEPWTVTAFRFLLPHTAPNPPLARQQSLAEVMLAMRTSFSPAGPITMDLYSWPNRSSKARCVWWTRMPHRSPAGRTKI